MPHRAPPAASISLASGRRFATLALLVVLASPAQAGVLTSATWMESVLGVSISVPVVATGTSTASAVSVSLELPEFHFDEFVDDVATGYARMRLTAVGSAVIVASASMAAATMGVFEYARVDFRTSPFAPYHPWYRLQPSPGAVGGDTRYFVVAGFPATLRAMSYGWTPGAVAFTGLTSGGGALPDALAQGAFALDAFGAGTVTLVAPRRVVMDGNNAIVERTIGSFTTLTLHFATVPEPGTWLLLGAAAGALALRAARAGR